MSATPIIIAVPTAGGASGWIDCSALPEQRTLNFLAQSTADKLEVDFAMGPAGEAGVVSHPFAGSATKQIMNAAPRVRIRRIAGSGVCSFGLAAFVPDVQIGPAGPPAIGQVAWSGDLTTTDAVPTPIPSSPLVTPIGNFGATGFIPGADGTYSVFAHAVARGTAGAQAGLSAQFILAALFDSVGGVVTQIAATLGAAVNIQAGFTGNLTLSTDATAIQVVATGVALNSIVWTHNSVITRVA